MKTNIYLAAVFILAGMISSAAGDQPAETKQFWIKNCAMCHGADGKAGTKAGRKIGAVNFTDPKNQEKYTDEKMFRTIKEGVKDKNGRFTMVPAENVTDEQIKSLIALVRSFKK